MKQLSQTNYSLSMVAKWQGVGGWSLFADWSKEIIASKKSV